jgi:cell division septum initiation protein DivIVA
MFRGAEHQERDSDETQALGFAGADPGTAGDDVLPRFPITRHGYDCRSVDEFVAQVEGELAGLDRELAELRARREPRDEVANEIKRIGEQTSTVLIAAHEQREEMLRVARDEADRWVAEATTKAREATTAGEARLRELGAESDVIHRERDRLLEDVRAVSAALAELADSATRRIPPKPVDAPVQIAPQDY